MGQPMLFTALPLTITSTGVNFAPFGPIERVYLQPFNLLSDIIVNNYSTTTLAVLPAGTPIQIDTSIRQSSQYSVNVITPLLVGDWIVPVRITSDINTGNWLPAWSRTLLTNGWATDIPMEVDCDDCDMDWTHN